MAVGLFVGCETKEENDRGSDRCRVLVLTGVFKFLLLSLSLDRIASAGTLKSVTATKCQKSPAARAPPRDSMGSAEARPGGS
jgi:hypothetical protein